jgi:predicted CopG family antitoxin
MAQEDVTTIQLNKSVVRALKRIKKYPRETYSEVILDLIKTSEEIKELDKFVQEAQKTKMEELWGEGDYTVWENHAKNKEVKVKD